MRPDKFDLHYQDQVHLIRRDHLALRSYENHLHVHVYVLLLHAGGVV